MSEGYVSFEVAFVAKFARPDGTFYFERRTIDNMNRDREAVDFFHSLYGRLPDGIVEWIGDYTSKEAAETVMNRILNHTAKSR